MFRWSPLRSVTPLLPLRYKAKDRGHAAPGRQDMSGGAMTPMETGVCARQVSERDVAVLRWVGEQYAIPRDLLPILLGRLSDDETARAAGRVTATVVDRALRRWRDLGLADSRVFLRGEA